MLAAIALMIIGFAGLVMGGELLVRGASRLAAAAGVSSLVIGLTVVAFGTSAPELAVSIKACYSGQTDIAVGNVVGSNMFNVLFVLGVSAMISPLIVSSQLVRIDVPLMIAASFAVFFLGLDGSIGRFDGLALFGALICYISWTVVKSRQENAFVQSEFDEEYRSARKQTYGQIFLQIFLIIAGLALLTLGARWLVNGAVTIARLAGMSELLIGLTIVAVGTSLPEVVTSVMASLRGERDIAVGNAVGSNIFNLLCVIGLSAAVVPDGIEVADTVLRLDMPVMIAVSLACLPIFFTGHLIARWEGVLFFAYYLAYTTYLILEATFPPYASRQFGLVMIIFVVPLTFITLAISVYRSLRSP